MEHNAYWKKLVPGSKFPYGAFGENFTTEGILETEIHIGDQLAIGSALFVVSQPRLPCFKLGIRFDDPMMVKRFVQSGRSGLYLAVLREGEVGARDEITITSRDPRKVSVADVNRLFLSANLRPTDLPILERALEIPILPEMWREHFSRSKQSFCGRCFLNIVEHKKGAPVLARSAFFYARMRWLFVVAAAGVAAVRPAAAVAAAGVRAATVTVAARRRFGAFGAE